MKKTVITFGLISGAVSSAFMLVSVPFWEKIGFDRAEILGYTSMILAFLLVFFGIRSYRDNVADGTITFAKGFGIGILITLISCVCYTLTWEVLYFTVLKGVFIEKHMEHYVAHMVEQMKASGATQAQIQAKLAEMKHFAEMYNNPLFNFAITMLEPLPVGVGMTLLSAAILRRKARPQPSQAAMATVV
jgi:hypothetical protein